MLNGFGTRLGHRLGRQLASLFHQDPAFRSRQVATFHNQRDFIFFRCACSQRRGGPLKAARCLLQTQTNRLTSFPQWPVTRLPCTASTTGTLTFLSTAPVGQVRPCVRAVCCLYYKAPYGCGCTIVGAIMSLESDLLFKVAVYWAGCRCLPAFPGETDSEGPPHVPGEDGVVSL